MAILDNMPRASFDKLEFPFTSRTATLSARTHVHEFPRMAGGAVEKLGRKLWTFSFECPFHATHPDYPDLYPDTLNRLVERAARLDTAILLVPEIGEIHCIITDLRRQRAGKIRSGEDVSLTFLEDDIAPANTERVRFGANTVAAQARNLALALSNDTDSPFVAIKPEIEKYRAPLGSLLDCVNRFLALGDQLDLYSQRAQAGLAQVLSLSRQVHDLLTPATLDPVRRLLRSLWDAAHTLHTTARDIARSPLIPYVVPQAMAIGAVAYALYGDSKRGGELIGLNTELSIDPFSVRAGTRLQVPQP